VLGLPLGSTAAVGHSVMLNWVGAMPEAAPVLRSPAGHWHDYGKTSREGRKVGHATLRAEDRATLRRELETAVDALSRREEFNGVIARLG
jgi:5-(carboxyamino)imidazole ribonucleotide synthase